MSLLYKYGWYFLLIAIMGEILIPFLLAPFYKGYNHSTMVISSLGNINSPVRLLFNIWMLIAGVLLLLSIPNLFISYHMISRPLSITMVLFIGIFAVGACIFTCFFSVNETKDVVTMASKIHGIGSVIGFMVFLFIPLFVALLAFKSKETFIGITSSISFVLAMVFFVLFIMADKAEFQNTIIAKEGLWQRLNLLFMYLPLASVALNNIIRIN